MGRQHLFHRHQGQGDSDGHFRKDKEDSRHRERHEQQKRLSGDDEERRCRCYKPGKRPEVHGHDELRHLQDTREEHKRDYFRLEVSKAERNK